MPVAPASVPPAGEACVKLLGLCLSNKVDAGLIATVIIFVLTVALNNRSEQAKRRKERDDSETKRSQEKVDNELKLRRVRRQYLVALREEIGLNIEGLEKSSSLVPSRRDFSDFLLKDANNRPLITSNYLSAIYRNRTEVLQDLPDTLIKNVVEFYGKLDEIAIDVAAVNSPAFVTVSHDGKLSFVLEILTQMRVALQHGKSMRDAITLHLNDTFGTSIP